MARNLISAFPIVYIIFRSLVGAEILDIERYIEQVAQDNEGYIASRDLQNSYQVQSLEGSLSFTPRFVTRIESEWLQDPQFIPYFPIYLSGATLINQVYKVGLEQQTPIGFDWQLQSQSSLFEVVSPTLTNLIDFISSLVPGNSSSSTTPGRTWSSVQGLTVTQHLWKNGFGESARARANQLKHSALAKSYQEQYKIQTSKMEAQSIYWQLVIGRALTEIRRETLEQSEKLVEYIQQKKMESLVLDSEIYQALTIRNTAQIDYQRACEAEAAYSLKFNSLRGISSPVVVESLIPLEPSLIDAMMPPYRGERSDLKAYREQIESQKAQNLVAIHDLLPEMDISGGVGLQGNSSHFYQSLDQSIHRPAWNATVLFKLSIPLSPFKISSLKRSYRESSRSADLQYERTCFEHDQEWDRLIIRLQENKQFLLIQMQNSTTQQAKYENAKSEYDRGLTTIFVVTSAQSDYQLSKISILQNFQIIIDILIHLSMYETH